MLRNRQATTCYDMDFLPDSIVGNRLMDKPGPGRPHNEVTEVTRKQLETLASFGVKQDDIASVIGIDAEDAAQALRRRAGDGRNQGQLAGGAKSFSDGNGRPPGGSHGGNLLAQDPGGLEGNRRSGARRSGRRPIATTVLIDADRAEALMR